MFISNYTYAGNEVWDAVSTGLNRYILVFGEVDACVTSAKQVQLLPLVAR